MTSKTRLSLTVAQRALLRRVVNPTLVDLTCTARVNGFTFVRGADIRTAWNLFDLGLVFIGTSKVGDPKGTPVRVTERGHHAYANIAELAR
jgi:hypothetical protein